MFVKEDNITEGGNFDGFPSKTHLIPMCLSSTNTPAYITQ